MKLVRVVGRDMVAGFETDGTIRRTAPILKRMRGWTDDRARKYMKRKGWKASIIPEQTTFDFREPDNERQRQDAPARQCQ